MKAFLSFVIVIILLSYFMLFFDISPKRIKSDTSIDTTSINVAHSKSRKSNPYEIKNVHYQKNVYSALIGYYKIIFKGNKLQRDLFAIEIGNRSDNPIQVFVNIAVENVSYPNQKIITIPAHTTDTVSASPQFIQSYLVNIYEQELNNMTVSVDVRAKDSTYSAYKENIPITFLPVNSMKYAMYDKVLQRYIDTRPLLAAYVDPAFFEVDEILRHVSKKSGGGFLAGYQELTAKSKSETVLTQMSGIFYGLRDLEMTYLNNPVDYSGDQKIKTPSESIKYQSANCIEGVIIFASIIEALGMQPLIVLVPGHAFVGWKTWDNSKQGDFLETTMIWNINNPDFETALSAGRRQFTSATEENFFKSGKAVTLDIVNLRSAGVTPISVDNSSFTE